MRKLRRRRWIALAFLPLAAAAAGAVAAPDIPSVARSKASVQQMLALPDGVTLVRSEFGVLFATKDGGNTWTKQGVDVPPVAVSDRDKLWAFHGWPGVHEKPSARTWYSTDRGNSWIKKEFRVPGSRSPALYARMPATFINEPESPPLVVMYDLQIMRPEPNKEPDQWSRVGTPVPVPKLPLFWEGGPGAVAHRGAYYVAAGSTIFMSIDGAKTWSRTEVPRFADARLRCRLERCYALLDRGGSEWSGAFVTDVGKNDWQPLGNLTPPAVKEALAPIAKGRSPVARFGACDLLPTESGLLVAAIVNAGEKSWGAVLRIEGSGKLRPVGGAVDEGLWRLEQDSSGRLWAGGLGAFVLRNGAWARVWSGG